jgi:hypothetical protein
VGDTNGRRILRADLTFGFHHLVVKWGVYLEVPFMVGRKRFHQPHLSILGCAFGGFILGLIERSGSSPTLSTLGSAVEDFFFIMETFEEDSTGY